MTIGTTCDNSMVIVWVKGIHPSRIHLGVASHGHSLSYLTARSYVFIESGDTLCCVASIKAVFSCRYVL